MFRRRRRAPPRLPGVEIHGHLHRAAPRRPGAVSHRGLHRVLETGHHKNRRTQRPQSFRSQFSASFCKNLFPLPLPSSRRGSWCSFVVPIIGKHRDRAHPIIGNSRHDLFQSLEEGPGCARRPPAIMIGTGGAESRCGIFVEFRLCGGARLLQANAHASND